MKIIGLTADGALISATQDEISQMTGVPKPYGGGFPVGSEIKVNEIFKQQKYLKDNEKTLIATSEKLKEFADHLLVIQPILESALKEQPYLQPQINQLGNSRKINLNED